jgi:hypothetical protein
MKKYFKIRSSYIGVGVGFLNFYFLFYLWAITWEISFVIAFILGHLASNTLDIYSGRISQTELDKKEAKEISRKINSFKSHDLL